MRPDAPTVAVDSFVGRDADVSELRDAVSRSRLVTVTGTGGIGKSRLALEVSALLVDEFVDGCRTVSLSAVRSDDEVSDTVAEVLLTTAVADGSPDEQLVRFLADKQLLVVVDNCEHLLAGCRRLFVGLLAAAPGLRIVATSREPLSIAGERVITLQPLATPDPALRSPTVADVRRYGAVRLLEDRAVAVQSQFRLDNSNAAAVAQLAARLDGLPLAIELAASRLRSLSVFELTDRLDDRFAMLTGGDPTARTRHRTLRAMVEWSWELCSPGEQRLWAALPVFSGGADLEAISAVAGEADQPDVLDVLDGLVTKSVVSADTTMRRGRYTMIETMDAFGRERASEFFTDPDELATRHARYYLSLAERGRDGFYTPDQVAWTHRLRQERTNLSAAFDHLLRDDPPAALRLATALRFYWLTGPLREGQRSLDEALAATAATDLPTVDRIEALLASSWVAVGQGDHARATARATEADSLAARLEQPVWTQRVGVLLAIATMLAGDLVAADREFTAAIDRLRRPEDLEYLLLAVSLQVAICLQTGHTDRARGYFAMLTELCDECGETWIKSYAQAFYAFAAWRAGDVDGAAQAASASLRVKLDFADTMGSAMLLGVLAAVAYRRGDLERAAELFGHTAVVNRGIGVTAAAYGVAMDAALNDVVADVRRLMGDDAFDTAFARGGHMTATDLARLTEAGDGTERTDRTDRTANGGPHLLTDREHQVATLVSQGLSNRVIAERLVLSPRTIDGHLERIFGKLAVRSRAAVSAWVVTHPRR